MQTPEPLCSQVHPSPSFASLFNLSDSAEAFAGSILRVRTNRPRLFIGLYLK